MNLKTSLLLLGLVATFPAYGAVTLTPSVVGVSSSMPGSGTDFTLFGNPTQFPTLPKTQTGVATQPTILNDFQATAGTSAQGVIGTQNHTPGTPYSSITTPGGIDGVQTTGALYGSATGPQTDLVNFLLGGGNNFNYSNFTVYVMISNAPTSGLSDQSIVAGVYTSGGTALSTFTLGTTDYGANATGTAEFYAFTITGAAAGETLELGATGANGSVAYLGGVSFASGATAPEPSTWAMMGLGLAALAFWRRRATASL